MLSPMMIDPCVPSDCGGLHPEPNAINTTIQPMNPPIHPSSHPAILQPAYAYGIPDSPSANAEFCAPWYVVSCPVFRAVKEKGKKEKFRIRIRIRRIGLGYV